jgi:hypothetical protein
MSLILGTIWPYLAGGAVALFGILYALVKGKTADAKVAKAGEQVAQAQASAAVASVQTAQAQTAEAQANATAAAAGAQNLTETTHAQNDVAALPAGSAADELRAQWSSK